MPRLLFESVGNSMMNYILEDDHTTRRSTSVEEDAAQWKKWAESGPFIKGHPKVVDKSELSMEGNEIHVSTVFLGLDHGFDWTEKHHTPILFETMIFGGEYDDFCRRYATWDEAQAGHTEIVEALLGGVPLDDAW